MKKIYEENNFNFVELTESEIKLLSEIEPERMFVSKTNIDKIKQILKLEELSNEELQPTRNAIVKYFTENQEERFNDNWTRMSMIVAVIDDEIYKRGLMR